MHSVPGRSWRWPLVAAFLVGGLLPAAADETRILGQVTQGEVNDVTRGALMDEPTEPQAGEPASALPSSLLPPPAPLNETARLPDEIDAMRGDANAMYRLAGRYEQGDGVAQNTAIALSWYGRAADSGIADAVPKVIALREQLSREDALSRAVAAELTGPRTTPPEPARPVIQPSREPPARAAAPAMPEPQPTPAPAPTVTAAPTVAPPSPAAPVAAAAVPPAAPATSAAESLRLAASAPNDAEALRHYRAAAEQGSADGAFNLGYRLANGKGTAQNDAEAARWYRAAAEQGNAAAQNNLGFMYASGRDRKSVV